MSRSFVVGLSAVLSGVLGVRVAWADHQASVVVRAQGTTGSVERVQRSSVDALDADVQAGTLTKAALRAELSRGVGRFLQNVRTEAVLSHGQFVGWRLLALFPKRGDVHVSVLKPGDVVLRVNGESIERPEAFKRVWDSLDTARELVIEIERDGQRSALHYSIVGA